MKIQRSTVTLLLAASACWRAAGQTTVDLSRQGKLGTGTTLPVRCTVGQVFFKTDAPTGSNLYACASTDTWAVMGLPTLGGDASGNQQSLTVKGIQGRSISPAGPADQNVLRWNAASGQWEPGAVPVTGTNPPPGTCAAGTLYLLSDPAHNLQQLYICTNTNTWSMASFRSGTAASRPANCVAGQTWLSTDSGSMTYCTATGNPGTWSATLAGPPGPSGANGATILTGAAAPPAGAGGNGDFYLNTAAGCLYGPKASGAWPGSCTSLVGPQGPKGDSGLSGEGLTYLDNVLSLNGALNMVTAPDKIGVKRKLIEPNSNNSDNFRSGVFDDIRISGLKGPDYYSNSIGRYAAVNIHNGLNSPDNTNKKTQVGDLINVHFGGGGQKFGRVTSVICAGSGDCGGQDTTVYSGGHPTAWGDESTIGNSVRVFQQMQELFTPINSSTATSCNTTSKQSIPRSTSSADLKVIPVVSTAGCNVGDWVTIQQGIFGSTDTNVEVVKLTAVNPGVSVTAQFQLPHDCGACTPGITITPSNVLGLANMESFNFNTNRLGQDRVAVLLNGPSYSAGSIASITGNLDTWYVTGQGGANWSTGMVGGNSNLLGCISFDSDTFVKDVYSSSPLRSWYPIVAASGTSMTIYKYTGSATGGAYMIRPCARIGAVDVNTTASDMTISAVVLQNNSFAWDVGKTFDETIDPWGYIQHGIMSFCSWYGPGAQGAPCGSAFRAANDGYRKGYAAFTDDSGNLNTLNLPAYRYHLLLRANTSDADIDINGKNDNGYAIQLHNDKDNKKIRWEGAPGAAAELWATSAGFQIESTFVPKMVLSSLGILGSRTGTLDYSSLTANRTWSLPNVSGEIQAPPGGNIVRTIPDGTSNNAVDIGTWFPNTSGDATFSAFFCASNTCKTYNFSSPYLGDNVWYLVRPLTSAGYGDYFDLNIRSEPDGRHSLRLVGKTSSARTVQGNVSEFGSPASFTPSTAESNVTRPSMPWPSLFTMPLAPACTVAALPASPAQGQFCYFTDAASSTDCTTGGGTAKSLCIYNGAAWSKP